MAKTPTVINEHNEYKTYVSITSAYCSGTPIHEIAYTLNLTIADVTHQAKES